MKNSYIPRDRERDAQPLSTIACQQLTVLGTDNVVSCHVPLRW